MTIGEEDEPLLGPYPPGTYVTDPNMGMVAETEYETVDGSAPTGMPNRFTLHVPHHKSTLSLGKGSSKWISDDGITMQTDKHAHIHINRGGGAGSAACAEATGPETMVLLGGSTVHGWSGPNGANNPAQNQGFMVVTEGFAWQESREHQYLMSKNGDAVLRTAGSGKRAVLQADEGDADVMAKSRVFAIAPNVTIVAPATYSPSTAFNYSTPWTSELPEMTAGDWQNKVATWFDILLSAHDLVKGGAATVKTFRAGEATWETYVTDLPKYILDCVDFASAFGEASTLWSPAPGAGQFKAAAESDVTLQAGNKVSVWAGSSAGFGGARGTSVGGGISTSVKAALWASMGAAYTGVKGLRKVEVLAEYGPAAVKAKTTLELISEHGDAKVSAKKIAQVVADDVAFFHGKNKTVATAGDGSGTGVICQPDRIFFGSVSKAKDAAASAKSDSGITLDDQCLVITKAQAGIKLQSSELMVAAPSVVIQAKSSSVKVEGSRILIG